MGWSGIGCYGIEVETPNLDRLASSGLRFTQMHNASKCFLSGVYAQQNGMSKGFEKFTSAVTLGEVLRTACYRTYASGKHHSEESLFDRGFDHYCGLLDGACNHFNPGPQGLGKPPPAQKNTRLAPTPSMPCRSALNLPPFPRELCCWWSCFVSRFEQHSFPFYRGRFSLLSARRVLIGRG